MTNTALLVIDAQRIYTDPGAELFCTDAAKTLANINRLVDVFCAHRRPIVFVRHVHAADGSDVGRMFDFSGEVDGFNFVEGSDEVEYAEGLHVPSSAHEMTKTRYSAFRGTDLDDVLRQAGVSRVAICGFMTNFCCESTAREAHDRDYYVSFVTDATGCPDLDDMPQDDIRGVVSTILAAGFATIVTTEDAAADLS
ncbi:MAG: isochorismatase family cysteine hydrolase [Thermoleophilia bacterium]